MLRKEEVGELPPPEGGGFLVQRRGLHQGFP